MRRSTIVVATLILLTAVAAFFFWEKTADSVRDEGLLALRRGNFRKAFLQLERHLANERGDDATRSMLADVYRDRQEFTRAVVHYQVLKDVPKFHEPSLRSLAAIGIMTKETTLVESALRGLIRIDPDDYAANLAFAELYFDIGRLQDAIPFAQRCITARPDRAQSYLLFADILGDLNRDQEMVAPLEASIRLDPENMTAHANLAYAHLSAGNTSASMRQAEWCLDRQPDLYSVRLILAKALRDDGDFNLALQHVETVITAEPSNLDAALFEADLLVFIGKGSAVYDKLIGFYEGHADDRQLINHLMRAAAAKGDTQKLHEFRERLSGLIPK